MGCIKTPNPWDMRVPFPQTFPQGQAERSENSSKEQTEQAFSVWKSRLGILDYLSRNPVFSRKFPLWGHHIVIPFTFQAKFPDLGGK